MPELEIGLADVSIRTLTSHGIGFLETLKNPANLSKINLNKTRNIMKSQIQIKKKKKEGWNCAITNTNVFPKKASQVGTKTFLGKRFMGKLF